MRGTRRLTRLFLAGAVSAALGTLLAACGHTVSVGADRSLRVALTEYRVIPQSIESRAGRLTILVDNDGRLAHNLAISRRGTVFGRTPPLRPGASAYLSVSLQPGSYQMTSTLFSDQALGEYGTLTVVR